jgi:hypothetical protein
VSTNIKILSGIIAAIVAILGLIAGVEPARTSWCNSVGLGCIIDVKSDPTTVNVSSGNPCNNGDQKLCVSPSSSRRHLDIKTMRVVTTQSSGAYNDGDVAKVGSSNTGWYVDSKDVPNSERVCIHIYARTGDCRDKYAMTGQLIVGETVDTPWIAILIILALVILILTVFRRAILGIIQSDTSAS